MLGHNEIKNHKNADQQRKNYHSLHKILQSVGLNDCIEYSRLIGACQKFIYFISAVQHDNSELCTLSTYIATHDESDCGFYF